MISVQIKNLTLPVSGMDICAPKYVDVSDDEASAFPSFALESDGFSSPISIEPSASETMTLKDVQQHTTMFKYI